MPVFQPIEDRLVDAVGAHQLANVGDDVPLLVGERGRVALGADQVDDLLAHAGAAGGTDLRGPDIRGFAFAHRRENGDRAQFRLDDIVLAIEGDQRKQPRG